MRFFLAFLLVASLNACSGTEPQVVPDAGGDVTLKPGGGGDDAAPAEVARPDDSRAVGDGSALPPGYFEFCLVDGDCGQWGLTCFSTGPSDQKAFCSAQCVANSDCPAGTLCKRWGEGKACQKASYCDQCDDDGQCGSKGRCVDDKSGGRFCTYPCKKDDLESCGAGHFCNKIGAGLEDYFCFPMFGACRGDGTHCTPCQSDDDCLKGHYCHENAYTFERYCAKMCTVSPDCPKGFFCHELVGEDFPLCTLEVDAQPVETCYKGNKDFCEPCLLDYECTSGVCYNYPVAQKYFCSFPCDDDKWPQGGCPSGLFCVPNHGESGGKICAPSPAFGCQGFLNCVAVTCAKGEKCVDGFCQPK